ncbi:hypothetical protein T492DRAFT_886234 [Pavlovales sp. CCMP2436]|nr:hypothetical protein T492DRAFT_886234 [Pavlovales sp. CCMP2436]
MRKTTHSRSLFTQLLSRMIALRFIALACVCTIARAADAWAMTDFFDGIRRPVVLGGPSLVAYLLFAMLAAASLGLFAASKKFKKFKNSAKGKTGLDDWHSQRELHRHLLAGDV